jgi:hypothetical protein
MRLAILALVFALVTSLAYGHYGHGIQYASIIYHAPTGPVQETGLFERIVIERNPYYPRGYIIVEIDWITSDSDPQPHVSGFNVGANSPADLHIEER